MWRLQETRIDSNASNAYSFPHEHHPNHLESRRTCSHLLCIQAALHKRSMKAEARDILTRAVTQMDAPGQTPTTDTVNAWRHHATRTPSGVSGKDAAPRTPAMRELRGED